VILCTEYDYRDRQYGQPRAPPKFEPEPPEHKAGALLLHDPVH